MFDGKIWYHNKETIKKCREYSDRICRRENLSVIENPKKRSTLTYAEYIARKSGTSWKVKMCDIIDKGIKDNSVNSLDELIEFLRRHGYTVTRKKYISIKSPYAKNAIRSFRLGDAYSMEALIYRIRNKDRIMSLDELDKYEGIAYECAVCLRGIQKIIYRRELSEKAAVNADYSDLLRSAELLCFLSEHNIKSDEDFQNTINAYDEKYRKNKEELEDTKKEKKLAERVISGTPRFLELKYKERFTPDELTEVRTYMDFFRLKIDSLDDAEEYRRRLPALENEVKELSDLADNSKKERNNATEQYKTYLEFKENTFGIFLEQKRQEELMRRELYRQQTYNTERHYNTHRSNSAR